MPSCAASEHFARIFIVDMRKREMRRCRRDGDAPRTGLWQISGRNNTTYRRRVALDTAYSRGRNIGLDIAILVRTVPAVLTGSGSY